MTRVAQAQSDLTNNLQDIALSINSGPISTRIIDRVNSNLTYEGILKPILGTPESTALPNWRII